MYWCLQLIYMPHDCNEWKPEKHHKYTNMGKVKRLELWWQLYVTLLLVRDLENFKPLDVRCTECTNTSRNVFL